MAKKGHFSFSGKSEVNLWTFEERIFHTIASKFECSIFVLAWLQLRLNDCEIAPGLKKADNGNNDIWGRDWKGTRKELYGLSAIKIPVKNSIATGNAMLSAEAVI